MAQERASQPATVEAIQLQATMSDGIVNASFVESPETHLPAQQHPAPAADPPAHGLPADHLTSYAETIMHIFKGNVGPGLYAMGDAFRNGGLLLSPILTLLLGVISVHSEHILLTCAGTMQRQLQLERAPDFAETVGLCFAHGHVPLRRWAGTLHAAVNFFICVTQLGLCCVYFVFISSNVKQIYDYYGLRLDVHWHMLLVLPPMLLPALITNLRSLACMTVGNACMALGIGITYYYALQDLPPLDLGERHLVGGWRTLPLFFGTAIFAFEGIALVLPLQGAMRRPRDFARPLGVLNVGMAVVTLLFATTGLLGYLRWGDAVQGSLTLNLPEGDRLAQAVKLMISTGILFGYALQLFVAVQIMLPAVRRRFDPRARHPARVELLFRVLTVLLTFLIAEGVPNLGAFISLIGALCSTALALIFPPVSELTLLAAPPRATPSEDPARRLSGAVWAKNGLILLIAAVGVVTGTYESVLALARSF